MLRFFPRKVALSVLVLAAAMAMMSVSLRASDSHGALSFHGKVYQVDTIGNFVDVDTAGGRVRIYTNNASIVRVHKKRAALIDIAMGEEVGGTYRADARGTKIVVKIDDLAGN